MEWCIWKRMAHFQVHNRAVFQRKNILVQKKHKQSHHHSELNKTWGRSLTLYFPLPFSVISAISVLPPLSTEERTTLSSIEESFTWLSSREPHSQSDIHVRLLCLLDYQYNSITNTKSLWLKRFKIWFSLETFDYSLMAITPCTHTHKEKERSPFMPFGFTWQSLNCTFLLFLFKEFQAEPLTVVVFDFACCRWLYSSI